MTAAGLPGARRGCEGYGKRRGGAPGGSGRCGGAAGAVRQRSPRLRLHRAPPLSAVPFLAPGGRYRDLRVARAPFLSASPRRGFSSRWVRERGGKSLPSLLPAFGTAQPLPLP